jgi:hypothetical protein
VGRLPEQRFGSKVCVGFLYLKYILSASRNVKKDLEKHVAWTPSQSMCAAIISRKKTFGVLAVRRI